MCLSLELDFEKLQKKYRMLAAGDETFEASCAYAVSVPTTPSWRALMLLLESATLRRREKSKHVAETLLREFLSNACSPSCLENLLRLEAPAHGNALGHDAGVTSDGSATRATQLARGMVAAAQLCFTSAESRALLRSLVVSLSEDIDCNVIHKRARGDYDPLKHAGFVDSQGKRSHVDEHYRASLIQAVMRKRKVQSQGSIATTVDRVPQSLVRWWVHEDMRVLQSAWWRFCSDAHVVYKLKEDGARIGQPGRRCTACFDMPDLKLSCQRLLRRHRTEKLLHVAWALEQSKHAPGAQVKKLAKS